ncbi:carcinoembryonic antigen-related cell adhesion molecule 1 [Echeneis naucrates]|uniref:Carcinoembryonic antigen-related cell adhesion molecule 1-like n=1 Tax=Echeneis naucrates TaxID=173247 RepID=A0A665U4L6_ECHNA|nr:carcinoembryonic antigen-related cell adhesion molecule 1-like [Echeneis naucrates]
MDLLTFKSLLFFLSLIGCSRGQDPILPEGPINAEVGKNVTLATLLVNPKYSFITWNYNSGSDTTNVATLGPKALKVGDLYVGRASINRSTGALTLMGLKPEDSGDYSISILAEDSTTKTGEIKLQVMKPVSNVVIKSSVAEAIEHNSTVVLTCSADGSFLTFTWTNGSNPIQTKGTRFSIKDEEMSSTLTITGVLRSDLVGPIYCAVANKLEEEKSDPFNLTVYYGPEAVTITPVSPPEFVGSSSNFSLTCSASSSPAASFGWSYNQQPLKIEGPVLRLDEIQKLGLGNDVGQYSCVAKNAKTERLVASPAVSFSVMDPISGIAITGPLVTLIAGNSSANLSCQVKAGMVQTRMWLKDGRPLSASSRLMFSNNMSSLRIDLLQKEDNGVFTCQFANPVSTEQASYKMVVNYGPEGVMVKGANAVEVKDTFTLTCLAESVPPANYTWKFNGTLTATKTAEYVIKEAAYKDSGMYTCEAHNAITGKTVTSTHTMSVKEEIESEGLSDGAIAGIVIAVLVALAAAIGLIIYCRQKVPVESPY